MSVSARSKRILKEALADQAAGTEIVAALNTADSFVAAAHVTPVAVTFTANTPGTYGSPTGSLAIADGTTPTVVELLKYCDELRGNIATLSATLLAQGITS